MPTPNYVLNRQVQIPSGPNHHETKWLEAGTFVRPILTKYVPAHVLERFPIDKLLEPHYTYAYSPLGIVVVPKEALRIV